MSMVPGARIFGRYTLGDSLPPRGELHRWQATDAATSEPVEVIAPSPLAALRPGAEAAWRQTHHDPPTGALASVICGRHGGRLVAVRPPSAGPWDQPLTPEQATGVLASVGQQIIDRPDLTRLDPEDLWLDTERRVVLAPSGIVPHDPVGRPARLLPPEGAGGPSAALYGLGVLVFHAVTDVWPVPGDTPSAHRAAQDAPLSLAALVPGVSVALAEALSRLLSSEPSRRASALPPPGPPVQLPEVTPPPQTPAIVTAPAPDVAGSGRRDHRLQSWNVVVEPASLTRAARRRVAALTGHPIAALERAAEAGLPVPLTGGPDRSHAEQRAAALAPAGAPATLVAGTPAIAASLLTGALLLGALITVVAGLLTGALPAAAIGGVGLLASGGLALRARQAGAFRERLRAGQALLVAPAPPATPESQALRDELTRTRAELLAPHVPDAVRADLLHTLDSLDDLLDTLPRDTSPPEEAHEAARTVQRDLRRLQRSG